MSASILAKLKVKPIPIPKKEINDMIYFFNI
jgi:hypothetical protein